VFVRPERSGPKGCGVEGGRTPPRKPLRLRPSAFALCERDFLLRRRGGVRRSRLTGLRRSAPRALGFQLLLRFLFLLLLLGEAGLFLFLLALLLLGARLALLGSHLALLFLAGLLFRGDALLLLG